jgi:hypothetical protein
MHVADALAYGTWRRAAELVGLARSHPAEEPRLQGLCFLPGRRIILPPLLGLRPRHVVDVSHAEETALDSEVVDGGGLLGIAAS